MLDVAGTLLAYAFILFFPCAGLAVLLVFVRFCIRKTPFCDSNDSLEGKTIVVTGGSSGLGRTLSTELARRGARVIVACRTRARRDSTGFFLRSKTGSFNVRVMYVDFSSLDSVWEFARELVESESRVDIIVNNAATLTPRDSTGDGIDTMMSVNYVGHFLLVNLLQKKFYNSPDPDQPTRVINVICGSALSGGSMDDLRQDLSGTHAPFGIKRGYRNSKLALYLFNRSFSKHVPSDYVASIGVDPGLLDSALYRHLPGISGKIQRWMAKALYRSSEAGIQTILYCILLKDVSNFVGKVFKDCQVQEISDRNDWTSQTLNELWESTIELIKSKGISFSLQTDSEEEEE